MYWKLIGAGVAAVIGIGVAVAFGDNGPPTGLASPPPSVTPVVSPTATPVPVGPTAVLEVTGTIEGPVSYPAGGVPNDLRVCADNLQTGQTVCAGGLLHEPRFPKGVGYRLRVPAGSYQVYAISPSFDPNFRAYYSRFVTCGYREDCTDHTPIPVSVGAGAAATGIEPGDFYRD